MMHVMIGEARKARDVHTTEFKVRRPQISTCKAERGEWNEEG